MKTCLKTIAFTAVCVVPSVVIPQMSIAAPTKTAAQRVTIVVDERGYTPSTLKVKAGQTTQLTFVSRGESCGNTIVIPALKKTITLQNGQRKSLSFVPKKGQTLAFACPMKMFNGKIIVR